MVARMLKSLKSLHVDVRCSSDVVELIFEKGRVAGVCTVIAGERSTLHASGGVILATGGFGHNEAMIRRWVPFADLHVAVGAPDNVGDGINLGSRSEEHTSELQSLMRISYAVFCLKKKKDNTSKHQKIVNNHTTAS